MSDGAEMERRLSRGKEIAARPERIERIGMGEWSVPSQTQSGRYRVVYLGDNFRCSCPDYAARLAPCKHIYAVRSLFKSGRFVNEAKSTPRKQYIQHSTYTQAQTAEMRLVDSLLHDLVSEIPDLPRLGMKGGRPPIPLSDAFYCAILKVYSGLSGRRAHGVYENVSDRDLLNKVPSYNVASRVLNKPESTAILYRLLQLSATPLAGLEEGGAVAPDSTGIQTTSFGAWREEKHGEKRQKRWLKVHAVVGTRTHIVIRAVITEADSGDSPQFAPLLKGAIENGFRPNLVVADKAYLSRANYTIGESLKLGTFIPFKSNSTGDAQGSAAWRKAYHLFQANREEFDRRYHVRSNVEAVFSSLKRKFGEHVRSRTSVAQVNEIVAKLICYNLTVVVHEIFENGIAPAFLNQKLAT